MTGRWIELGYFRSTILSTQRRRDFNAMVKAAEDEEKGAGLEAAAAAATAVTAAESNRRPPQVDVSKLAHFRYSKIKVWTTCFQVSVLVAVVRMIGIHVVGCCLYVWNAMDVAVKHAGPHLSRYREKANRAKSNVSKEPRLSD